MRRREFIAGLSGAAVWPLAVRAQQEGMPVIGWLDTVPGTMERFLPSFAQGLAETGYVVGRDVTIEPRGGDRERLAALAADLVRRNVRVIVAVGGGASPRTYALAWGWLRSESVTLGFLFESVSWSL
jgi:putative tryptophan/tyrosine transport system substrate-binding protein